MKSLSLTLFLLLFAPFSFAQEKEAEKEEATTEEEAEEISVKPELRLFTSVDGKKIQAALVDRDDEKKTFKLLVKGRSTPSTIPFDKISPEDLTYIKKWPKAKSVFLQKCRGLTIRQLLELRGYEPIPFKFEGNAIMITGKLNGKPAKVQIDTGAGTTLLHAPFTTAAGCKIGPMDQKIWGVAGFQPAGTAEIPKLELGSSIFLDEEIQAADRDHNMPKGFKRNEDILLGAEYLIKLEAVISYKERTIFFRPDNSDIAQIERNGKDDDDFSFRIFTMKDKKQFRGKLVGKEGNSAIIEGLNGKRKSFATFSMSDKDVAYVVGWSQEKADFMAHCRGLTIEELLDLRRFQSFQYERKGNHIFVDGTLNDNEVLWMIDTGADSSLLHLDWAKRTGCKVGPMNKKVYGIGGSAPAAATDIDKITMGDATLTNRILLATDLRRNQENKQQEWVGLFGADYMRELEAVITYRESRIFLKRQK